MTEGLPSNHSILVVDDTPSNLLLGDILEHHGYIVRWVTSGRMALDTAENGPPDLVFLDVDMPEMDVYEVVRQLKTDRHLSEIPIIFISAKDEVLDKVTTFKCGAADYISNPFTSEEVLARVKTHLTLITLRKGIESQVLARTAELEHRNRALNEAHELLMEQMQERTRELRKSEERFDLAMRGANDGLYDWDYKTGETFYSDRWMSMLGYQAEELEQIVDTWASLCHPDDVPRAFEMIEECVNGVKDDYNTEFRMRHKNGNWVPVLSRAYVVRDPSSNEVLRFVGTHVDLTERKEMELKLKHQATHDYLTGLPNRKLAIDRISNATAIARRNRSKVAVLFLDLDGFKAINDALGHDVGDCVLTETAGRLRGCLREADTVARIGGDEFLIVLSDAGDKARVSNVAEKVILEVARPYKMESTTADISASLGIALYPDHGDDPEALIKSADQAMYEIKRQDKNNYAFAGC